MARGAAALLLVAFLGAGLAGCATGSAAIPANLPAVSGGVLTIVTTDVVDAVIVRNYNNFVATTGAFLPITACTIIAGSLPPGMDVLPGNQATPGDNSDDDKCLFVGQPTASGSFIFTLQVRDNALIPQNSTIDLTLVVRGGFGMTAFTVDDAVAGRAYSKTFQVTSNLQNNPVPDEIGSAERGNGPATGCQITGLPANMTATCAPTAGGDLMDVTIQSTGPLTASGPLELTMNVTDTPIMQDGVVVVPAATVTNTTTGTPFNLPFAVRGEFSITSAVPVLPEGTQNATYDETVNVTTDTSVNATESGQAGEFGNGPITNCEIQGLPADLTSSFTLTGGGTGCDVRIDSGTITAAPGVYPLTLVVTDSDIIQNAATVVAANTRTQNFALTVNAPLAFNISTVDAGTTAACTGGTFADAAAVAPDAVTGRTYGGPGRCDLLFTATGGSAPMTWNVSSAPAFLACTPEGAGNRLLRCNSGGANASGATTNLTVDVTDNAGANVTADTNGHATHSVNVLAAMTLAVSVGTATDLPNGVQGRAYADTALSTCGAAGATACQALVYMAAGGLGDPTVDGSYIFSSSSGGLTPADVGVFPTGFSCTTGTNPAANTHACVATAASPIAVTTTGTYTPSVRVDDIQNDTTPSNAVTQQRNLAVQDVLALAANLGDPLPTAVNGRSWGNSGIATCSGGACVPAVYTASGGLGDATVDASYSFSENATGLTAPGAGFPSGILCTTGTNPNANQHTCAATVAVAVTTEGNYTPSVSVVDVGDETTPIGGAVAVGRTLPVNAEIEFALFTATNSLGPFTPADPFPPGVVGRSFAADIGGTEAAVFLATAGTGLGGFVWDAVTDPLPGDLSCFQFNSAVPNQGTVCISGGAPQPTAGVFPINVTLNDTANQSTPPGAQSTDNLGHSTHAFTINEALSIDSITPLDSATEGELYSNQLEGSGGLTASHMWVVQGEAGPPFPLNSGDTDCDGLSMDGSGLISGTSNPMVADRDCFFAIDLTDAGNSLTPPGGPFSRAFTMGIAPAGSPVIDNDVLVSGLDQYLYSQSFTATGGAGGNMWFGGGAAGAACTTTGGTLPTGTMLGAATGALDGTTTAPGTFPFSVCVEDMSGGFNLKNFSVRVLDNLAYVANAGSSNVSAIDTALAPSVTTTIAVGSSPQGAVVSPDGTRAYIHNGSGNSVSVIDTATNTVINTIAVGAGPAGGIDITPDGAFVYVANFGGSSVSVIDTATGTVVATVGGIASPNDLAVTPDGTTVYVVQAGGSVVRIATASNTLTGGPIAVGLNPFGIALTPDGRFALVVNERAGNANGSVSVITTASNTVTTTITVGNRPHDVAVTPDGRFAYVPNADFDNAGANPTVSVIDLTSNTVSATLTTGDLPNLGPARTVGITPDDGVFGTYAYVINRGGTAQAVVIDTATNTEVGGSPVNLGSIAEFGVGMTPYPVLHFTAASLPDASEDTAYATWVGAQGGVGPLTWSVVGDGGNNADCADFEAGLDVNTGVITATPNFEPPGGTLPVTCTFDFTVTDSATVPQSVTRTLTITVN